MIFVPEVIIDKYIESFHDEKEYASALQILESENDIILQFIDASRIELLTHEEASLLEFICIVIYCSCKEALGKTPVIHGKILEEMEENNWEIWNTHIKSSVNAAFDAFFHENTQEDLLAFIEDSVQQDEEWQVSSAGMELITVTGKSIIDAIDRLN